ncbi:MAG TPA: M48 family metallopeptidase [Nitrospiraceae bacterium]|nr:M48 family metallopeptidase [Nitrospiraceae bacterium]
MNGWRDKEEFKSRVLEWADRLGVEVRFLAIRPMRHKWASCSLQGNLNFNAALLHFDRGVGDYVIVHELLHFSVPNHGKLWKSLMRAYLGDYERQQQSLDRSLRLEERRTGWRPRRRGSTEDL